MDRLAFWKPLAQLMVRRGRNGKWRFTAYERDELIAVDKPWGSYTQEDAIRRGRRLLRGWRVKLEVIEGEYDPR